ncbi:NADPH:quinone reductase-like Zn-dependent oxidoreductase [Cryobacterium psychrophilum]|uniref:NAD(P)-dependent alcohol dehydrogenase n=1 Tax=Cryobacterium psychrophilum TaxID=41988 RepID=A0A4Y8KPM3_9MICO|nr:NADPH:quinone reductase-like Zn-dependent oxidoreductase [Cryobacterium psychrophilum]TFD78682.1 NAD(P)-dependent alcohol dehydrogenase [Cryobacterium psychrophilum]
MKAIIQRQYGGPETYEQANLPKPVPDTDEVLIRVRGASLNAADILLMRGEPYLLRLAFGLRGPRVTIRGRDAAGVVEAVGSAVHRFTVGDEVFAEVSAGSFAEYTVAPERVVSRKPTTVSFESAATVPVAGTTALQGLRDVARVRPGDSVLINGAAGGVGSFAVQLARALGAEVTAVCSTRNVDLVRSVGAHHVIDYATQDFASGDTTYDAVFDLVGNRTINECRRALKRHGTLVLSSGAGGRVFGPMGRILGASVRSMFVEQTLRPLVATASAADLDVLREHIEAGRVSPAIERTYPLAETKAAVSHLIEHHARGKVAISV